MVKVTVRFSSSGRAEAWTNGQMNWFSAGKRPPRYLFRYRYTPTEAFDESYVDRGRRPVAAGPPVSWRVEAG